MKSVLIGAETTALGVSGNSSAWTRVPIGQPSGQLERRMKVP
jgi:hypothetical protein